MPSEPSPDSLITLLRDCADLVERVQLLMEHDEQVRKHFDPRVWNQSDVSGLPRNKHPRNILPRVREEIAVRRSLALGFRSSEDINHVAAFAVREDRVCGDELPSFFEQLVRALGSDNVGHFVKFNFVHGGGVFLVKCPPVSKESTPTVGQPSRGDEAK